MSIVIENEKEYFPLRVETKERIFEFSNFKELFDFADREVKHWEVLLSDQKLQINSTAVRSVFDAFRSTLDNLTLFIVEHDPATTGIDKMKSAVSDYANFAEGRLLRTTQYADALAKLGSVLDFYEFAIALAFVANPAVRIHPDDHYRTSFALSKLASYLHITSSFFAGDKVKTLLANAESVERKLRGMETEIGQIFDDIRYANKKKYADLESELVKIKLDWDTRREAMLVDTEKALEELVDARNGLENFMKLQAPVRYWEDKSSGHKTARMVFGTVITLWFLITPFVLFQAVGPWLFDQVKEAGDSLPLVLVIAGKGLLLTTLYLWVSRVLVRLFLSEYHLAMDAEQRLVATKSYLAMVKNGDIDDSNNAIVLEALFRPAQDGIVKDDASAEPHFAAFIQNRMKG